VTARQTHPRSREIPLDLLEHVVHPHTHVRLPAPAPARVQCRRAFGGRRHRPSPPISAARCVRAPRRRGPAPARRRGVPSASRRGCTPPTTASLGCKRSPTPARSGCAALRRGWSSASRGSGRTTAREDGVAYARPPARICGVVCRFSGWRCRRVGRRIPHRWRLELVLVHVAIGCRGCTGPFVIFIFISIRVLVCMIVHGAPPTGQARPALRGGPLAADLRLRDPVLLHLACCARSRQARAHGVVQGGVPRFSGRCANAGGRLRLSPACAGAMYEGRL
jgi:hypothetical protein